VASGFIAGTAPVCAGKPCKFTVVTANAGAGTLCAQVEGPSKVALVCSEVPDGYEFSYTPMAPGKYMIMIKYSNITIAGAPFKSVITGQSPHSTDYTTRLAGNSGFAEP